MIRQGDGSSKIESCQELSIRRRKVVSTLDGPIWSKRSIAPPGHISSAQRARENGARVGMNVTAHPKKEENEKTKKGKRGAGEKKKQATDFKKAVCCPSAVVQGAA